MGFHDDLYRGIEKIRNPIGDGNLFSSPPGGVIFIEKIRNPIGDGNRLRM